MDRNVLKARKDADNQNRAVNIIRYYSLHHQTDAYRLLDSKQVAAISATKRENPNLHHRGSTSDVKN